MTLTFSERDDSSGIPPAEFVDQVRAALERLHDFPFLQSHPLATWWRGEARPGELAGQRLRRALIDAIESLNPGREFAFLSPQARLYNLLHMRYVDGMTVQKTAAELGISMRQAHRDLRRGEQSVAMVMWAHRPKQSFALAVQGEPAENFEAHPRATDLCSLIRRAVEAVGRLAEQRGVVLDLCAPAVPVVLWTDPGAAQQVCISVLSSAVSQSSPGPLKVVLETSGQRAQECPELMLSFTPTGAVEQEQSLDPVVKELAHKLNWEIESVGREEEWQAFVVRMPAHRPLVLIIDDNQGLVELIERYLTGQPCRVVAAHSGLEGL
ncbi:MAG: hypothetical protein RMN25_12345, partial [Anaerolineae bacterium]|nr:hypothetical protein [Thermoflexales bacterium]MDW8408560.1 hypothetical protein [Anaerolineae bacterium]